VSDLIIKRKRWSHRVTERVDGAAWRCQVCGWLGDNLYSIEGAQREGMRHFAEAHPELETVDVEVGRELTE
jgi:rubredoxin